MIDATKNRITAALNPAAVSMLSGLKPSINLDRVWCLRRSKSLTTGLSRL